MEFWVAYAGRQFFAQADLTRTGRLIFLPQILNWLVHPAPLALMARRRRRLDGASYPAPPLRL